MAHHRPGRARRGCRRFRQIRRGRAVLFLRGHVAAPRPVIIRIELRAPSSSPTRRALPRPSERAREIRLAGRWRAAHPRTPPGRSQIRGHGGGHPGERIGSRGVRPRAEVRRGLRGFERAPLRRNRAYPKNSPLRLQPQNSHRHDQQPEIHGLSNGGIRRRRQLPGLQTHRPHAPVAPRSRHPRRHRQRNSPLSPRARGGEGRGALRHRRSGRLDDRSEPERRSASCRANLSPGVRR